MPVSKGFIYRRNFKLVIAEPLHESGNSHVQHFMDNHKGPGLQHIGLSVAGGEGIEKVVEKMVKRGAEFRRPPPTYYKMKKKVEEIDAANGDLMTFSDLGLLLDSEADCDFRAGGADGGKFLIQIFTKPIFGVDTFFLEVLERRGARGFGAGNITALAKSIILYQTQLNNNYL